MSKTTVTLYAEQKQKLTEFRSRLELERGDGESVSLGEAVGEAADRALAGMEDGE